MINFFAILSALGVYLLPLLTGRVVLDLLHKKELRYPFVSYFVIGNLFLSLLVISFILFYRLFLPNISFIGPLKVFIIVIAGIAIFLNLFKKLNDIKIKKYLFPLLFSIFIAFVVYSLWQLYSPYPFNWDIYEHQTLINEILKGKFNIATSKISDTFGFNSYSVLPYIPIISTQLFFNISIFDYWNALSLVHFTLIIFAAYLFAIEVTNNKIIAFLSLILGGLIFDSNMSFTSLFFIPQTFTAMAFMYLFIQLLSEIKKGRILPLWLVAASAVFLFFNHYIIGTAALVIYLLTYFYYRYYNLIKFDRRLIIEIGLFIGFLAIILSPNIFLGFINSGEAAAFTPSLTDKINSMKQIYGLLLIIFLPIGVAYVLRKKTEMELISLVIFTAIATVILMQLPYILKFYVLGRMFSHLFIAIGLYVLISRIKNLSLYFGSYIFLIISLAVIFITNAVVWKGNLQYNEITSQVSPYELEAASFLKNKYQNSNILLISDPATQHILEPLSTINTQGGAYMKMNTRKILNEISQTDNTDIIALKLYQINDSLFPTEGKRLLALSGRYFAWQDSETDKKYSLAYNIWYPLDLTLNDYKKIEKFNLNKNRFKKVFENQTVIVFEVIK